MHSRQSKQNNTGKGMHSSGQEFSKIEIESQDNPAFLSCLLKDCGIGKTLQLLFAEVNDLMTTRMERLDCAHRDADIC